jgi:glycerol uptake facilitator protein
MAHLNPAVAIGLASIGKLPWEEVPIFWLRCSARFSAGAIVWLAHLPIERN